MPAIAELRRTIQRRTDNVYDTLFTRRVSIYVTAMLAPLGVTPNQISVVDALVGAACCGLIAFGEGGWLYLGAGLLHIYAVLDSVDGELARLTRNFSLKGLFIEDLSAYGMINGMHLAVALHLWRSGGNTGPLALAVVSAAFGRNAMAVARRALVKSIESGRASKAAIVIPSIEPGRRTLLQWLRYIATEHVFHITNEWVVLTTLVALETAGWVTGDVVRIVFYFYVGGFLLREALTVAYLCRGDALERELAKLYTSARAAKTDGATGLELA